MSHPLTRAITRNALFLLMICLSGSALARAEEASGEFWLTGSKFSIPKQAPKPGADDIDEVNVTDDAVFSGGKAEAAKELAAGVYDAEFVFLIAKGKTAVACELLAGSHSRKFLQAEGAAADAEVREHLRFAVQPNADAVPFSLTANAGVTLRGVMIRRQGDLCMERLTVDKVLYAPGSVVSATVKLKKPGTVRFLRSYLTEQPALLGERVAAAAPAGDLAVTFSYNAGQREFGQRLIAQFQADGAVRQELDEVFNVNQSVWDVYMGVRQSSPIAASAEQSPESLENFFAEQRASYCNAIEKIFWAPDDWGDMTPQTDDWVSGQMRRHETLAMLKQQIAIAHRHGMKAITYGKGVSCGAAGYELYRRHPGWFQWAAEADPYDIDHWNEATPAQPISTPWYWFPPRLDDVTVLDHGIDEIIASARQLGWDGVRFDGHFSVSDPVISHRNMRRMKERVWNELPGFLFGYNMPNMGEIDWKLSDENREALAGGGLWMNEGINAWRNHHSVYYGSIRAYLENELKAADLVREHGGIYLHIMSLMQNEKNQPIDYYYKFVAAILANIRPAYGDQIFAKGCDNWGYFITRWSGLIWHKEQRRLDCSGAGVTMAGAPQNLFWQNWARIVPGGEKEEVWSLPLLLLPERDAIGSCTFPKPATGMRLQLPDAARKRLKSASWIVPDHEPLALTVQENGEMALPPVWPMAILALTLEADKPWQSVVRKPFAEVAAPPATATPVENTYAAVDPNKPELNVINKPTDAVNRKYAVNYSVSLNYNKFADASASQGFAAGADRECRSCVAGVYYWSMGPGRYRITARVKATRFDIANPVFQLIVRENLKGNQLKLPGSAVSASFPFAQAGKAGEWIELTLTDQYEHLGVTNCSVTLRASIAATDPADARVMIDWVGAEQLESYTDTIIAEKLKMSMTPAASVGPKEKVLWLRGLYDGFYRIPEAGKCAFAEALDLTPVYQRNLMQLGWTAEMRRQAAQAAQAVESSDKKVRVLTEKEKRAIDQLPKTERLGNTGSEPDDLDAVDASNSAKAPQQGTPAERQKTLPEILACYGTIIAPNLNSAKLDLTTRKIYCEWVLGGGRLVLLGGNNAFGNGRMNGTFIEKVLPCAITGGMKESVPPQPLGDGADCVAYYLHPAKLRQGATVLLGTADAPILCGWKIGKGYCFVFNGTVLGASPEEARAFWNASGWPEILAKALKTEF